MALTDVEKLRGVELLDKLNEIEFLNSGGCLFACLGVYKALLNEGINDINIVIVQLEYNWQNESIENNKKFIEGRNEKAYSSSHFGLSFDGGLTFYDCDGKISDKKYPLHLIIPNNMIEIFSVNALKFGGWNPMFSRVNGIDQINKILGTNLETYY